MAARGVRASVVRLPPSVHGDGDHGFVPILIGIAREKGVSAMWATGSTAGPRCTGSMPPISTGSRSRRVPQEPGITRIAEEGVPFRDIAGVIGRRLNVPVVAKSPEEAADHFGWFAHFAAIDSPASSRANAGTAGVAAEAACADSRYRPAALFRKLNRPTRPCVSHATPSACVRRSRSPRGSLLGQAEKRVTISSSGGRGRSSGGPGGLPM